MIEVVVRKDIGGGALQSAGVHPFEALPQIGHSIEIIDPPLRGKVVDIIHSSSKTMQQTEIVIQVA